MGEGFRVEGTGKGERVLNEKRKKRLEGFEPKRVMGPGIVEEKEVLGDDGGVPVGENGGSQVKMWGVEGEKMTVLGKLGSLVEAGGGLDRRGFPKEDWES